jgi:hypothetical protein
LKDEPGSFNATDTHGGWTTKAQKNLDGFGIEFIPAAASFGFGAASVSGYDAR